MAACLRPMGACSRTIDRSGEFPYVSHLLGSLEAAGTRPLTEILENPRGAGSVRVRVPCHPRSAEDGLDWDWGSGPSIVAGHHAVQ